jgi:hypothetical protein
VALVAQGFAKDRIDAIVFKGCALGLYYGRSWLRPFGDLDLIVHRDHIDAARATLRRIGAESSAQPDIFIVPNPGPGAPLTIDLHDGLPGWYDLTTEDLFAQAEPREVAPGSVFLTPSLAHHLRLVSLHMFKHGAWRPLWLCDVAALAEAAGPEFDTAACFGSGTFTRDWTQSALAAARDLLGADVSAVLPGNVQAPPWVLAAILSAWRRPSPWRGELPFGAALKDPKAWLEARWPDPIEAVFKSGALPWPARPRLTQTKHFLKLLGPAMAHFATPGWWARALAQKRRSHVQEASTGE